MQAARIHLIGLIGVLSTSVVSAQGFPGIKRIPTQASVRRATIDLDSGEVRILSGLYPNPGSAGCFANNIDIDPPGSCCYDTLLFPAGDELFDWGVKSCGGSNFVESLEIGFASQAVPTLQGGPGGSLVLRIYAGGRGFGVPGSMIAEIALSGLPSEGPGMSVLIPWICQVDLGSQAFFLPDGPIAWSYENPDGLTAPILVDVTIAQGTQNYYDVYRPGPASMGNFLGTFTLSAGGLSNDPYENSFYIVINENDTAATEVNIPAGNNPDVLTVNPPVVGSPWVATIDRSSFSPASLTLMALTRQRLTGVTSPFGEVIIDPSTMLVPLSTQFGSVHSYMIPLDGSLVGLRYYAQGAVLTPAQELLLTNARECVIGTL